MPTHKLFACLLLAALAAPLALAQTPAPPSAAPQAPAKLEDEILQSSLYMDELHRGSKPPRPNNCMRAVDKLRQQGVPIPAAAK
jgi:hypothetical protein